MKSTSRTRLPLLLFAGSVLVVAVVIASTAADNGNAMADATAVAADAGPSFEDWARQDPSPEEPKGKLLGHVERDGQMVEVREMVREEEPDTGAEPMVEPDPEPEPASLAQAPLNQVP